MMNSTARDAQIARRRFYIQVMEAWGISIDKSAEFII